MRIQKFLSVQGICSRRKAEQMISEGLLRVNGEVALVGQKVNPEKDQVTIGTRIIPSSKHSTLAYLVNKPKGYICSMSDPYNEDTVFSLLPKSVSNQIRFCAGRLDKDSEGMVILTNDGSLVQCLTHPSQRVVKKYRVLLDKPFSDSSLPFLLKGIHDQGEHLKLDKVLSEKRGLQSSKSVEVHLSHGKKREIRRLMKAAGYKVDRLYRFQFGGLKLTGLGKGKCRPLTHKEIALLTPPNLSTHLPKPRYTGRGIG